MDPKRNKIYVISGIGGGSGSFDITPYSGFVDSTYAKKGYYTKNSLVLTSGWYYNNDWVGLEIVAPSGAILESSLNINGLIYHLDDWYDTIGNIHSGVGNSISSSGGYSINYQSNSIRWNYTTLNSGFNINDNDHVVFYYYTE